MPPCWTDSELDSPVYLLVLASPMHVNLFLLSPCMYLIPFGLYYIFDSLYFLPFVLHPLPHVTSHHLSAPIFIQCSLYYIITDEGNRIMGYIVYTNIF